MRDSKPLKVLYKLTETALSLADKLNIPLGLESRENFNSNYYLRAVINNSVNIKSKELIAVNTGLHVVLIDPFYEIVVSSYMDLLKNKGISVFPCNYYRYGNEITVFLYNYSDSDQTINPGDRIALLSFKEVVMVETQDIDSVYKDGNYIIENLLKNTDYLIRSKDHGWVQKEKNVIKSSLKPELLAEINTVRVVKNSTYLCIEENDDLKSNIAVTKGTFVKIKKIRDESWRKVLTTDGHLGWIRLSNLENNKKDITQGETINSLIEKRLK